MACSRTPGPICTLPSQGSLLRSDADYFPPSRGTSQSGSVGDQGLTPEEQELALDVAQVVLDIVGILEPTPFADGSNALISLGRKDWLGAGLSALGIIPYIGDLAKAGKLPRYLETLWKAVEVAKTNANFAQYLRPPLQKLNDLLSAIPMDRLSKRLQGMVKKLKEPLQELLGKGAKNSRIWWEILEESASKIPGTSIPEWFRMRVGKRQFTIMRNAKKLDKAGNPIGPATKHLGEKATSAIEWAKISKVDFPISSIAGALEEATKKITSGSVKSGDIFKVDAWELGINTTKNPWVVFHAVYNPKL